ncbi:hypothetical protein KAR91_13295 [Candidatus Pacearchaeota archaeon]|nr:hypothetical protein [Candidatus Pacearchaeota archaeon]
MSSIYGLSEYGTQEALATVNVLPSGTNKYIALLTALPTARDGTSLVEASGASYARIAHSTWVNVLTTNDTTRKNSGAITYAALTGTLSGVVGWAIYSAVTGGDLIAFGPLVDEDDVAVTRNFISGDQPRFSDQELEISLGNG